MEMWLSKIRIKQAELAKKIAEKIMPQELLHVRSLNSFLKTNGLNPDAFWDATKTELEHGILEAIYGYTDWIACYIIRSNNFGAQPLPRCDDNDLKTISKKYEVEVEFLKSIIKHLNLESALPMLGKIYINDVLIPDKDTLEKWALLFDWSQTA